MGAKVTYDTANRLATVTTAPVSGVITLNVEIDLYSDFKEDMAAPSHLLAANPPPFLNSVGGVPTDDGYTGQYFFFNNAEGWRLQPYDADHELIIVGNLQTSDAALPWWVSRVGRTIVVSRKFSNLAQGVSIGTSGLTAGESADLDQLAQDSAFFIKIISNKKELKKETGVWYLYVYDDDDTTPILKKPQKDKDGNDITDLAAGVLAQELINLV